MREDVSWTSLLVLFRFKAIRVIKNTQVAKIKMKLKTENATAAWISLGFILLTVSLVVGFVVGNAVGLVVGFVHDSVWMLHWFKVWSS